MQRFVVLLLLLTTLAGCADPNPGPTEPGTSTSSPPLNFGSSDLPTPEALGLRLCDAGYNPFTVGDEWLFDIHQYSSFSGGTSRTEESIERVTNTTGAVVFTTKTTQDSFINEGRRTVCSGGLATFDQDIDYGGTWANYTLDPACDAPALPLRVGDAYSYTCVKTTEEGRQVGVREVYKVVALETVEVPAGTFEAYRLNHTTITNGSPFTRTEWFSETACARVRSLYEDYHSSGELRTQVELELKRYTCQSTAT